MPKIQKLPTPEDLNELPRWALVAFAVFCGQQGQQVLTQKTKFWEAAENATQSAYYSAVFPPQTDDMEMQVAFEVAIEVTQDAARRSYKNRGKPKCSRDEHALDIARGALHLATLAQSNAKKEIIVSTAASIVSKLNELTEAGDKERIACLLREQFRKLAAAAKEEKWDDDSKIPDMFF